MPQFPCLLGGGCCADALFSHFMHPPPLAAFLSSRTDAWPLQRGPWASQEAGMIKKNNNKPRLGQQRAHRGLSEGWRNVTLRSPGTTAICHPYCWEQPRDQLILRKERVIYQGASWGAEGPGHGGQGEDLGGRGDKIQTAQKEHRHDSVSTDLCLHYRPRQWQGALERWMGNGLPV